MTRENMFEINDFDSAYRIVKKFAVQNGWVFEHDKTRPDVLVSLEHMVTMEEMDELPDDIRPAYRVVMHKFSELFALNTADED